MIAPGFSADQCIKCNICTAACPVAAATNLFTGPKAVGPQAQRYRHPRLPLPETSLRWCSGCGTCTRVCPHGVPVAEINIQAKARLAQQTGIPVRDHAISRPDLLGRLGVPFAPVANWALSRRPFRRLLHMALGIHQDAPMPPFAHRTLRASLPSHCQSRPPLHPPSAQVVAYFHGCGVNYYEPQLGRLTVRLLERLGYQVLLPPQGCCGLPLQSNGLFASARRYARRNLTALLPFVHAGIPILGTSTSCTLSLKHDYRIILGLDTPDFAALSRHTYDIFEFLALRPQHPGAAIDPDPLPARALYHPPCQLKSHGIGTPALDILARIPGLHITLSDSECCGVAGTYGLKVEKYGVARHVGESVIATSRRGDYDFVVSDSETCRWWLAGHTGLPVLHPIELLAAALGVAAEP